MGNTEKKLGMALDIKSWNICTICSIWFLLEYFVKQFSDTCTCSCLYFATWYCRKLSWYKKHNDAIWYDTVLFKSLKSVPLKMLLVSYVIKYSYKCSDKYTVYGRHFACKMLASAGMLMTNTKGLALQSLSPSLKVWRRRKTTHAGICVGVLKETKNQRNKQRNEQINLVKTKRPCFALA